MSNEDMRVQVEVWPAAADEAGIWLLSDDAWRSGNVPSDGDPHWEVERLLGDTATRVIHSTSWRTDGPRVILTYIAVVDTGDPLVRGEWPGAQPISRLLFRAAGKPYPHEATEPPVPRDIDVMFHAVRHLAFLVDRDDAIRDALGDTWRRWLADLEPALAVMYTSEREAA